MLRQFANLIWVLPSTAFPTMARTEAMPNLFFDLHRRRGVIGIALGALICTLSNRSAQSADTAAPSPPPAITVSYAESRVLTETVVAIGSLVPREDVVVNAEISGCPIVSIAAAEGDIVKKDQILARLGHDTLDVQIAQNDAALQRDDALVAQANAQIDQMRSAEVEALAALDRSQKLSKVGSVTQDVMDQRVAAARSAHAQVAFAEQSLALAQADRALVQAQRRELRLNLARTDIRAPADGVVLSRTAQIGAIVAPSGGPLFHIAQGGVIELDANVVESTLGRISRGQAAVVHVQGAFETVRGSVRLVSPEVDKVTRLGRVRIELAFTKELKAGLFARSEIEVASRMNIVVPATAVQTSEGRSSVKIVREGKVESRAVTIGVRDAIGVEILAGITPGDAIVTRAGEFISDGEVVKTVALAMKAN
jgi:RND family efflux transporter MFP subunit